MSVGRVRHTAELKHYPFLKRNIIKEHINFQALVPASTKFCPISVQKLGAKNPFPLAPQTLVWLIWNSPNNKLSLKKDEGNFFVLLTSDLTPNLMYR